jgi:hypothetical protein
MENLGIFYDHLVYFTAIGNILWPLGIYYGHLVYFMVIWYIFPRFGILYQEKSGNPAARIGWVAAQEKKPSNNFLAQKKFSSFFFASDKKNQSISSYDNFPACYERAISASLLKKTRKTENYWMEKILLSRKSKCRSDRSLADACLIFGFLFFWAAFENKWSNSNFQ